jgi:hypothetical protein
MKIKMQKQDYAWLAVTILALLIVIGFLDMI